MFYNINMKWEASAITGLEIKEVWVEIERLRENLHDITSRKGMKSPEAIRASQRLDNKLNEYNYLKK